ncbi:XF1762 family protein [Aneurinibacillus migulanus]|uniref:XF1762 family protein n=1 Tax=Aneurinibacillus migulanus TaxID=47500 RepID=UPI0006A124B5|nr:XF1762 family protein [Aneurinibacillus migulanus]CEH29088.1 Uncharacterized protein BN1090_A2_01514 [Aneurinibacillus migulanus]
MWYWLFVKEKTHQYIILTDEQVTGEVRWILEQDGYELIWDSALSYKSAAEEAKQYGAKQLKLETLPITLKAAKEFVDAHHRHHRSPQGHKFSIALHDGDMVVGVIIAGRPVSRYQDDGLTLEVTRCCVKEAYKNGVSTLYAAVCRVAQVMGYRRVITYTLTEESGISMKACNFTLSRKSQGGSWDSKNRRRTDKHPTTEKYLWVKQIS